MEKKQKPKAIVLSIMIEKLNTKFKYSGIYYYYIMLVYNAFSENYQ